MIEPLLADDAFLGDVESAGRDPAHFHLWWMGQSGFLIRWGGRFALLDPYLSESLTEKYAPTDKPHTRMTRRVVDPARLGFVEVISSSHNHTDHLDAATILPVLNANPALKLVIPESNRAFVAQRLGIPVTAPLGVDDGTSASAAGFKFTGVPAAHESIERDAAGHCVYLGYIVQFGGWTIYHSGDTVRYDGMAEKLRPFNIDIALLPINGHDPSRRVAGNLDGREAATLAHDIGAKLAVPCHYDLFEFNTATPDLFVRTARQLGQRVRVLRNGERLDG